MDVPQVVINEPDFFQSDLPTDDEDESGNNSSCNGLDIDRNKLHPLSARARKISPASLKLLRQRRISRSESFLNRNKVEFRLGTPERDSTADDDGDDDSDDSDMESDDDSSDDDIPPLANRRHTMDTHCSDVTLLQKKLEHLNSLRSRVSQRRGVASPGEMRQDSVDSAPTGSVCDLSQKRHSTGFSLPKKTLQKLRAKISSKSQNNSQEDALGLSLSKRRNTFGMIPKYSLPKKKQKAAKKTDDALDALLRRRRKISQTGASPQSLRSNSQRSRKRSSPSGGQESMSRKTSRTSMKEDDDEELLKLDRQSALLQMMLTEEMER